MKINNSKPRLAIVVVLLLSITASAQIIPAQLRQFVSDSKNINNTQAMHLSEIKEFYTRLNYQTAWIQKENKVNYDIFLNTLKQSAGFCLRESDYQFSFIEKLRNVNILLQDLNDSLEAEVRITDAAIHFYSDIAYGNIKPSFGYYGLGYTPGCRNITGLLADYTTKNRLHLLINQLSPALPEIKLIEKTAKVFLTVMADSNFREVIITSTKVNTANLISYSVFF